MLEISTTTNLTPIENELLETRLQFGALEIEGINDRANYLKVQEAAKQVRARRLELQKQAKEVETRIAQIKKDFQTSTGLVIEAWQELETSLREKMAAIDNEKARLKEIERIQEIERQQRELEKFNARVELLFEGGYMYNGQNYVVGAVMVSPEDLHGMDDAQVMEIVNKGLEEKQRIEALLNPVVVEVAPELEEAKDSEWVPECVDESTKYERADNTKISMYDHTDGLPFGDDDMTEIDLEPEPAKPTHPQGYTMGFDAARIKIMLLIQNAPPISRAELLEKIRAIEY